MYSKATDTTIGIDTAVVADHRVALPGDQRVEHRPPGLGQRLGCDRAELDDRFSELRRTRILRTGAVAVCGRWRGGLLG
jgi:hypothetical protein